MFTRVLLALDGSTRAERAIPTAVQLVRASGGTLILAQVRNQDDYFSLASLPLVTQELIEQDVAQGKEYLARIAHSPELSTISVEQIVRYGTAADTLLALIKSQAADLVVLSSHGRTGFSRWALGSVAEKVARRSHVPVLVLREGGHQPISSHPEDLCPLRVLVPLDGSVCAKAALEPAAQLAAALATPEHAAIHLLRVVRPASTTSSKGDELYNDTWCNEHLLHKAKNYLRSLRGHIREGFVAPSIARLGLQVTWSVALDADPAHAIIRVSENGEDAEGAGAFGGCQVIVMATHGRSGLQRWRIGNTAEQVMRGTKIPLLVVHPEETHVQAEHTQAREILPVWTLANK